jgi:Zn-dependent peptidase ImmA (M78 family)
MSLLSSWVATKRRTEFIQIHELAHAILYSLLCHPHFATNSKQMYVHLLSREEFCNEFARELLLPEEKIRGISLAPAEEAWSEGERRTHRRNSDQSRHLY